MKKTVLAFGGIILALFILFRVSQHTYLSGTLGIEIILAIIAVIFFFIGLYINQRKSFKGTGSKNINKQKINELNLSKREYEVLCEVAKGLSNKQIAEKLFVSESTVKTHVSNIFVKLDAKRRTEAIKISKDLRILPLE
ncbi:MAG: response regulator transcription factor [Flavobacteriaceae bacterium]|nr:response regulator transcription factor [Flavobacteriaceae bacterium]